jgi:tetratricopeptide (TPR) repeat protein
MMNVFENGGMGCGEYDWRGLGPSTRALFQAVQNGDADRLRNLFFEQGLSRYVDSKDDDGIGLLHIFGLSGDLDEAEAIVDAIVEAGGDINILSHTTKETALIVACHHGRYQAVKALLKHNARLDLSDWHGRSALIAVKTSPFIDSQDKEITIALVEEAVKKNEKASSSRCHVANTLREKGNAAFARGDWPGAISKYSQSIEKYEDYRAFSNRSACYLKKAEQQAMADRDVVDWGTIRRYSEKARADTIKATSLEPTFAKAWYRHAKAQLGCRDFPRTLWTLEKGLKYCPGNTAIESMVHTLEALGIEAAFSNPFCDAVPEAKAKLARGCDYEVCSYCGSATPFPLQEDCLYCACTTSKRIEEKEILKLFLMCDVMTIFRLWFQPRSLTDVLTDHPNHLTNNTFQ